MKAFELENLHKRYGKVVALRGLTVEAPTGAIGLLGPNGAGKTTMIRALLGLITFEEGQGRVLGRDIRRERLAIREIVGFAPEDECLFPGLQGVEFVCYAGELCGMPRKDALRRAHEMLDYVGLGEARYRPVEGYSTGMKQRLKIASALVHDPKLLILDEPTNGMDPEGRREILELARDLSRNKGMSLLFSSHLLPDVEAVCDHVLVMGGGRLLLSGSIAELTRRERIRYVVKVKSHVAEYRRALEALGATTETREDQGRDEFLAEPPAGRDVEIFWETARGTGIQVRRLQRERTTLEQVFLQAVADAGSPNANEAKTAEVETEFAAESVGAV
ncbi:ABC transporter related protein [Isosphaera pallida ATCC 43644]|uniref:ABC transporter related protein n=1 Tax=Isosphaera pallida (strain ATCC 43644 / DSM 9630 / IS1B) TaxID=575540 RepID=E8R490_ISOPI|nr:ABC transporter ATP-binding protein [Isosphaera pallida]ADV62691.1 ABC transporter related protein [Isosphaera pallida ATCC 43644]